MDNLGLIEALTWAIVELDIELPNKPKIREALEQALNKALIEQEKRRSLQNAVISNAKLMGD